MTTVRIAVIYYSATGSTHRLAESISAGAACAGAEVRLRRVAELAPEDAIDRNLAWRAHIDETKDSVEEAALADLEWAHGYAFGTPSRFGNVAAQLKQFMDSAGGLWANGALANKPVTAFTTAMNPHGGQESTNLALTNSFYHWGGIIVPPGYTDDRVYAAGGNPYGVSWTSGVDGALPDDVTLAAAHYQGARLALVTRALQGSQFLASA